jgi:hypothetical protein
MAIGNVVQKGSWFTFTMEAAASFAPSVRALDPATACRAIQATLASTGIRAGMEAMRIRIGDVLFETQQRREVIFTRVMPNQGKHPRSRSMIVYEGGLEFNVHKLLRDLIAWRESQ